MTTAPYGSWSSPVTVDQLTGGSVGLSAVRVDGVDLYWLEARADQGGRCSIWRAPLGGGEAVEVTPGTTNVRTRVHEYGGGAYDVRDGVVVHSELADGRLYRVVEAGRRNRSPRPATCASPTSGCTPTAVWCWPCGRTTAAARNRSTPSSHSR